MKTELHVNKETNVAYVDICPLPSEGQVHVADITDLVGVKTQVLARTSDDGQLLGLIIDDYKAFKRELERKYRASAVELLLDLIAGNVCLLLSRSRECSDRLTAHA
jgi:hypothetical protein